MSKQYNRRLKKARTNRRLKRKKTKLKELLLAQKQKSIAETPNP